MTVTPSTKPKQTDSDSYMARLKAAQADQQKRRQDRANALAAQKSAEETACAKDRAPLLKEAEEAGLTRIHPGWTNDVLRHVIASFKRNKAEAAEQDKKAAEAWKAGAQKRIQKAKELAERHAATVNLAKQQHKELIDAIRAH